MSKTANTYNSLLSGVNSTEKMSLNLFCLFSDRPCYRLAITGERAPRDKANIVVNEVKNRGKGSIITTKHWQNKYLFCQRILCLITVLKSTAFLSLLFTIFTTEQNSFTSIRFNEHGRFSYRLTVYIGDAPNKRATILQEDGRAIPQNNQPYGVSRIGSRSGATDTTRHHAWPPNWPNA